MTKTKQERRARPNGETASPFNSPLDFFQLCGAIAKVQASGWQQVVRMNQEYLEFLNRRLERDRELATDLADRKDPAEAWAAWAAFYQAAQRDYSEEVDRLTELYANGARAATADIQQQLEETAAMAMNSAFAATSATKSEAV
ncbi:MULTISPECIES: phasin family protein [Pseudophaeobacter]|uniref:phasin family protein n=1 Tax=Pseudophaeobacter TaxID=1541822 RepID=UPI0024305325|nr:phasin family protein [Pseudophaeobacter profundi]